MHTVKIFLDTTSFGPATKERPNILSQSDILFDAIENLERTDGRATNIRNNDIMINVRIVGSPAGPRIFVMI